MVVTLTKQQVAQIVGYAGAILPRKASIPVLAHALFEPDGSDRIKVTLTDLEQTLAISLTPEKPQGASGRFLFPVAELKTLKADTVTFQPVAEDAVGCTAAECADLFAELLAENCRAAAPPVATDLTKATNWEDEKKALFLRDRKRGSACEGATAKAMG